MDDIECYNNFIRFLKDNNIYKSFFVAFNSEEGIKYRKERTEKISLKDFILYCRDCKSFDGYRKRHTLNTIVLCFAFIWYQTKEGDKFWRKIYDSQ